MIFDRYGNRIHEGDSVRFTMSRAFLLPAPLRGAGIVTEIEMGSEHPVRLMLDGRHAVLATHGGALEVFVPDTDTTDFHTMLDRVKEWTQ